MLQNLTNEILTRSNNTPLFIVGISGLDASGKSMLSKNLADVLREQGRNVLTISGDSFQFLREYKEDFVEESWALQHVKRTINFEAMVNDFLEPLSKKPESIMLDVIDYDSGEKIHKKVELNYPLIVIVESIYLFQEPMLQYLDYKIFLEISMETALKRAKVRPRDLELYGDEAGIEKKYMMKNFAGYELFDKLVKPKEKADVVIDCNDWGRPVVL